ncbi:MAG TPA: hypothetical protein EYP87_03740 [Flavobacteriaceae bacterium]|nr:hypothetical protein [Flavobacteriaceae bacterium]
MIKKILLLYIIIIPFYANGQISYHLPKALIITSGADLGRGTVSDGVVHALQAFNKLGVFVRLENRKVLLQTDVLTKYDILIIPTIAGYHDNPQNFSLTYMSDTELKNIARWVINGGTLVTDINIGRNTLKGKDRILKDGILNANNWQLGKCFGVALKEMNTSDFYVKDTKMNIWQRYILKPKNKEMWRLTAIETAPNVKILAEWQNKNSNYPALTLNKYGKGNAFLLPTFNMLHPASDGGLSNEKQINQFYELVYQTSIGKRNYEIQLLPWKNAHTSVYCQTFDDGGSAEEYERIFTFIRKNKLPTVFFITPAVDKEIAQKLKNDTLISIQGHSYNHPDFRKLDYFQTQNEFLMNRQFWKKNFTGFRFPYVSNSFWGMYLLNKLGFVYETSIAANNMEFIRGSVVPYNIPIFNNEFYCSLDLLEISQMYRSDWYFYQKVLKKEPYTKTEQKQDAKKFETYLYKYFNEVVQTNNGVMVFLGHPMYSGISNITLQPLQDFVSFLKTQNVWVTSLNEAANRWNKLKNLKVEIEEKEQNVTINIDSNGELINGLTLIFNEKPKKIIYNKTHQLKEIEDKYYLVFDLDNKAKINIQFQ